MGEALFVGRRFLRGLPDRVRPELATLIERIARDDIANRRHGRWIVSAGFCNAAPQRNSLPKTDAAA